MKQRRFYIPDRGWDTGTLEAWLEHMARQGWRLKQQGTYRALFTAAPPADCRIRLEPMADRTQQRQEELDALYADMGWTRQGVLRDNIVYCCTDPDAPELHTDPAAAGWSRKKRLQKARRELLLSWLIFALGVSVAVYRVLTAENPIESIIYNGSISFFLLFALIPWLIWETANALKAISALRREMDAQLPLRHSGDWRKASRSAAAALLMIVLFWGSLLAEPLWRLHYANGIDGVVQRPYLEAAELDPTLDISRRETDFFSQNTSPLAPVQYHRREQWESGERLITYCNVLRFEGLAQPLHEERHARLVAAIPEAEFHFLSDLRFDRADFWTNGEREILYLVRGKAVMEVYAFDLHGLCNHLDDYAAIMEACAP